MNLKKFLSLGALPPLLALAWTLEASAQDDAIERCRMAETDQERIACLEAALRGPQTQSESPESQPEKTADPPLVAPTPPQLAIEEPAEEPPLIQQPQRELGAEQVAARAALRGSATPPASLTASVIRSEEIHFQRLQVTLDNEQVWRQIRGDNQRINVGSATGQSVEIWESNLGGYRMRLNEMARTIRVERIR